MSCFFENDGELRSRPNNFDQKKRWTKGVVAHQRRKSISHTPRLTPSGVQYDLQHFQNASHSFLKQLWFILCILCKIISLKRHIQMQNVSTILCCSCCIFQLFFNNINLILRRLMLVSSSADSNVTLNSNNTSFMQYLMHRSNQIHHFVPRTSNCRACWM